MNEIYLFSRTQYIFVARNENLKPLLGQATNPPSRERTTYPAIDPLTPRRITNIISPRTTTTTTLTDPQIPSLLNISSRCAHTSRV